MSFEAMFFWAGLAGLFVMAWVLSYLEADRMAVKMAHHRAVGEKQLAKAGAREHSRLTGSVIDDARSGSLRPPTLFGWSLAYATRRGRAAISVWRDEGCKDSAPWYAVTLDRNHGDCGDCVACMNKAIHWIQQQDRLPQAI